MRERTGLRCIEILEGDGGFEALKSILGAI
jgi:hypothetical protein